MNARHVPAPRAIRRTAALLALAVSVVAGCTSAPAPKRGDGPGPRILGDYTLQCERQGGNECWVPIVVTADATGSSNCTVAYVFSVIDTPKNIKVIWYLNRFDYEFDAGRGIDIKNNNGAFDSPGHHGGLKHQFTWQARAVGTPQRRNYDIVVRPVGSSRACDFVDPVIFNQG